MHAHKPGISWPGALDASRDRRHGAVRIERQQIGVTGDAWRTALPSPVLQECDADRTAEHPFQGARSGAFRSTASRQKDSSIGALPHRQKLVAAFEEVRHQLRREFQPGTSLGQHGATPLDSEGLGNCLF